MKAQYKFFWRGQFNNWTRGNFTVNGITFNCGEQYMMYAKAMLFEDLETAKEILETKTPREQKALGRRVKNFKDEVWDAARFKLVKEGLTERFTQDEQLRTSLVSCKDYILVEASPFDRIWGIGYNEHTAMANIKNWGQNLLGRVLTEIAQEI